MQISEADGCRRTGAVFGFVAAASRQVVASEGGKVEPWVLSMGTHATVIRPDKLRQRLLEATQALSRRYGAGALADRHRAG